MNKTNVLSVTGASALFAFSAAHAQCVGNFYLDAALGGAFQQDTSIQVSSAFGNSGDVKFNPGLRADLHFGYNITRSFAAELESGVIWNSVDSIAGNKASSGYDADLYEVPMLANIVYRPFHGAFQPYIGAGCGGVAGIFDSDHVPLYSEGFNATDWTFAYQAEAGFKYALTQSIELGIGYEFLGTTGHDWSSNGNTLKTDGTLTHAVVATFSWEF